MITVNPFLALSDNCLEAFNHYKKVFGGEFEAIQKFKGEPGSKHLGSDANGILHVSLPFGAVTNKFGIQWLIRFAETR